MEITHITSTHIALVRVGSDDHMSSQGELGNVGFGWAHPQRDGEGGF